MYITIKNIKREEQFRSTLSDKVDLLFAGTLDETSEPDTVWQEPNVFCRTKTFERTYDNNKLSLTERNRISKISYALHMHRNNMRNFLNEVVEMRDLYYSFSIPKRSGGLRPIDAPGPELKRIMYEELKYLKSMKILPHNSAWAYIEGRDVVGAMQQHINNQSRWYLKLDLENFFGSCNEAFIVKQLSNLYPFAAMLQNPNSVQSANCGEYLITLAKLATLEGVLPQGTPLSPMLTNMLMVEFDYKFTKVIKAFQDKHNLPKMVYTRYADDMIISCKDGFAFAELIKALAKQLEGTPLKFKKEKTRYASNAGRNWNLGVMCNKDNTLTVGHKKKNYIKQAINNFMYNGNDWSLDDCRQILGQLAWLSKVEPQYADGLMQYYYKKWERNPRDEIIKRIKALSN